MCPGRSVQYHSPLCVDDLMAQENQKNTEVFCLLLAVPPSSIKLPPLGIASLAGFVKPRWNVRCVDLTLETFLSAPSCYEQLQNGYGAFDNDAWASRDPAVLAAHLATNMNLISGTEIEAIVKQLVEGPQHPAIGPKIAYLKALELFSWLSMERIKKAVPQLFFERDGEGLVVGISGKGAIYCSVVLTYAIKEQFPKAKVVLGGPEVNPLGMGGDFIAACLPGVDFIVNGEGEAPLESILAQVSGESSNLVGCHERSTAGWVDHGEFKASTDELASYPSPDFGDFDLMRYYLRGFLPLTTTRGCLSGCTFCTERIANRPYREVPASRVAEVIAECQSRYGAFNIRFNDSLINGTVERLRAVCGKLIKLDQPIQWYANARAEDLAEEDVQLIQQSGGRALLFGLESYSPDLLKKLNKRTDTDEIREIYRLCRKHGIRAHSYLIVGTPGETAADIEATAEFMASYSTTAQIHPLFLPPTLRLGRERFLFPNLPPAPPDVPEELMEVFARRYLRCHFKSQDGGTDRTRKLRVAQLEGVRDRFLPPSKNTFPNNAIRISDDFVPILNRVQLVGNTVIVGSDIHYFDEVGMTCIREMRDRTVRELAHMVYTCFPNIYSTEEDALTETRELVVDCLKVFIAV